MAIRTATPLVTTTLAIAAAAAAILVGCTRHPQAQAPSGLGVTHDANAPGATSNAASQPG